MKKKKINRASGTCEIETKNLKLMISECQKTGIQHGTGENKRNNG